jgi:hypothetical protein
MPHFSPRRLASCNERIGNLTSREAALLGDPGSLRQKPFYHFLNTSPGFGKPLRTLSTSRHWTTVASHPYKASLTDLVGSGKAQVAQLVEHVTENHGVGGSIPPLGTRNSYVAMEGSKTLCGWGRAGDANFSLAVLCRIFHVVGIVVVLRLSR